MTRPLPLTEADRAAWAEHERANANAADMYEVHCPACGGRDVTESHLRRCEIVNTERSTAVRYGETYGVPAVTTADLWAHLGHVASPQEATRIVRQVLDLGWRPVVGKDPKRLWSRDDDARTESQGALFGGPYDEARKR